MLIYCAGPLDGISESEGRDWYTEAAETAPPGVVLYFPGHAFAWPSRDAAAMDQANRAVIAVSSGLLVNLLGPGRALGTIREVEFARSLGKPVVIVSESLDSLLAHDLIHSYTLDDAWEEFKEARRWPQLV